ncbi:MAG TPA: RsmE family RNA methyltransferase, partial [Segetibacter sp.]
WLPVLHQPSDVLTVIKNSSYQLKLIAHCEDEQKAVVTDYRKHESVQILIGPEGDFSKDEISVAKENNFTAVSLGETRLRTETAGIVAATLLCI